MHAIEIRGLTKTYGKARGVQSIDLTVESGAFFGFIGPNGAHVLEQINKRTGAIPSSFLISGRRTGYNPDL